MSDNVGVNEGTGLTFATDDISSVHYQRVKVTWGPDGTANDVDNADGKPLPVHIVGDDATTGALSVSTFVSAGSDNETLIKSSAGVVYGWDISNIHSAMMFLRFYNKASAPTSGTDTALFVVGCPAAATDADGGHVSAFIPQGIAFSTGIGVALTPDIVLANSADATISTVQVTVFYK